MRSGRETAKVNSLTLLLNVNRTKHIARLITNRQTFSNSYNLGEKSQQGVQNGEPKLLAITRAKNVKRHDRKLKHIWAGVPQNKNKKQNIYYIHLPKISQ